MRIHLLPGAEPEIVDGDFVGGNGSVEGFCIFLEEIWRLDVYKRFY
jgi:hypothetical protein